MTLKDGRIPHVIGTRLDTSAYIKDTVIFMTFKEAKQCTLKR